MSPEESTPRPLLLRAGEIAARSALRSVQDPFAALAENPALLDAHLRMLSQPQPRPPRDLDVPLVLASAKIAQADDPRETVRFLDAKERAAVLTNRQALDELFGRI